MADPGVEAAKRLLSLSGYVVLKAKSYRQAQERQRVAEAIRRYAEEDRDSAVAWGQRVCEEERRIRDRLTYVYGVAMKHGATREELAGATGFGRDEDFSSEIDDG